MKFICTQADLSAALSAAMRAIASRTSHPVLAHVLVTAQYQSQKIYVSGFDLSLGIEVSFDATVTQGGRATIPAHLLSDIVTKLNPLSDISIEVADNQVEVRAGQGRYKIGCTDAEEYPTLPFEALVEAQNKLTFPRATLIEGIRSAQYAISTDETKQVLTGMHLAISGGFINFASTDGHRLATSKLPATVDADLDIAITVPGKTLRDLERTMVTFGTEGDISLFVEQGQVVFQWGNIAFTSRLLDGQYPAYQTLIPAQFNRQIVVDRKALLASLDLVSVLALQSKSNVVKVSLSEPGSMKLSAEAQDVGNATETLDAQWSGDAIDIAFNGKYLIESLKSMGEREVEISMNGPTSPVIIQPIGSPSKALVMPVQIRE